MRLRGVKMTKIKRLGVRGFRAFGRQKQELEFEAQLAVIYSPNSQGKTSLAEAIEWLLTGKTVRREFLVSAKREYKDALKNVYMEDENPEVWMDLEDSNIGFNKISRELIRDYTAQEQCKSILEINDEETSDLSEVNIFLSQPPLEAPILMPHTLRFVVSTNPQDRTDYFKALLEVSDLEKVREVVSVSKNQLNLPQNSIQDSFERCLNNPKFGEILNNLITEMPSTELLNNKLIEAFDTLIGDYREGLSNDLNKRVCILKEMLENRRSTTFPLDAFYVNNETKWYTINNDIWDNLKKYVEIKSSIETEETEIIEVLETILNISKYKDSEIPLDCPVCETPEAITPERINDIKNYLESMKTYKQLSERAKSGMQKINEWVEDMENNCVESCPNFLFWDETQKNERGFTNEGITSFLDETNLELKESWEKKTMTLEEKFNEIKKVIEEFKDYLSKTFMDKLEKENIEELYNKTKALNAHLNEFREIQKSYFEVSEPLVKNIQRIIDSQAETEGWQDLINISEQRNNLLEFLINRFAYQDVCSKLDNALNEIDQAKEQIMENKFSELSEDISYWWELLRPDHPTLFEGVQPRGGGRRYIDLKARFTSNDEGDSNVTRDVAAVFSDSQLNCLGLAAFLARAVKEESKFVVLDDPVPASDEDHKAFFIDRVIDELINKHSIQVILLTHDQKLWKDVQNHYRHQYVDTFVISSGDNDDGAVIEKRSDDFFSLLADAKIYIKSTNPEIRKIAANKLRNAAERFCKLVLVQNSHFQGDKCVMLSNYDGKTLGELAEKVYKYLNQDTSHPGKIQAIGDRLNPGSHDDMAPDEGGLNQCHGDLKTLYKCYIQ